jgi:DNA-binding IclR family transcriptional regulator
MDRATSLIKALDLLTIIGASSTPMTTADLSLAMNAPRSTVVRILNTLLEYGLVEKQNGCFSATENFHQWTQSNRHDQFRKRYRKVLTHVARHTGELVLLGIQDGAAVVHIDYIESDKAVRVAPAPHTRHTLRQNALGKLVLARRPDLAARWIRKDSAFGDELEIVRRTGVAWNREESVPGMIAMASYGFNRNSTEPMISVAWPVHRFSEAHARSALASIHAALKQKRGSLP